MSFKKTAAVALTAVLFSGGCGLRYGEKAPPPTEMTISKNKYSCVGQIAPKVEAYLGAEMGDDEINSFIDCLQNAFTLFNEKFHGHANRDEFTPEEIRTFIQDNFLPKDRKISDELLRQFMIFKQNLVGGGAHEINRADLTAAVRILDQIRTEALRLRPFMPVLNPRLVQYQDPIHLGEKLSAAEAAVNEVAGVFGDMLSKSQRPYAVQNYEIFLREFRKFTHWDENFENSRTPKEWADVLGSFKAIAVSPDPTQIYPQDWGPLFKYGMRWYLDYIKFSIGIRNQPSLLEGNGFKNFVAWGDSVQNLLSDAVDRQPNRMISFASTKRLFAALKGVGWLPQRLRVESVESALEALVNKVFGPEDMDSEHRASPGITKLTLANLMVEYSQWQEIQMALQEKFTGPENRGERLRTYGAKIPLLDMSVTMDDKPYNRADWDRFIASFQHGRALFKEDFDRVFLVEQQRLPQFDVRNGFYDLSKMNIFRAALSLIFKGYANPKDGMGTDARLKGISLDAGISRDRFNAFYKDFRDFGVDIGFLDARTTEAGVRTFKEGKIFTYLADGIDDQAHRLLSYAQGIQEGAFLYSGGELSRDLYRRLSNDCPGGSLDLNGQPKLQRSCVRDHLVPELVALISTMPYYTAYLKQLSEPAQLEYSDLLLKAAYAKFSIPKEVELSELATVAMVVHYSEALMTNYNTGPDFDNVLNETEINKGVPIFTGLIQEIAAKKKLWDPAPANTFKFILAEGRLPATKADLTQIAYHASLDEVGYHDSWGLVLDRTGIAKVFATIIQSMTGSAPKKADLPQEQMPSHPDGF